MAFVAGLSERDGQPPGKAEIDAALQIMVEAVRDGGFGRLTAYDAEDANPYAPTRWNPLMAHLSTKTYGADRGLSCAFRQWAADSHCHLLHGYSLGFRFTFAAEQLDHRGWVVDFGKDGFGRIREWLHTTFDHTLLISDDDPDRDVFLHLETLGLAQAKLVPGTSCERLSQHVLEQAEGLIREATGGRCWVQSVECFEHGANSAIYENPTALLSKIDLEVYARLLGDTMSDPVSR